MVAASDRVAVVFALSAGQDHDAPSGRKLLENSNLYTVLGINKSSDDNFEISLIMDKAYEDDATRKLVKDMGVIPVVPPKSNRKEPWDYDRDLYKKRNEVERLFRRIKGFRRIFTRYEKLDTMFIAFITFALIIDAIK